MKPPADISLDVAGLGVLLHSPFAAAAIEQGDEFLAGSYWTAEQVVPHLLRGDLVSFGVSPGGYRLRFLSGAPPRERVAAAEHRLRLGVEVRDRALCVRDLYDLQGWDPVCPAEQQLELDDGFYRITLLSSTPPSGVMGDEQEIEVYLEPVPAMPRLRYEGMPVLRGS